MQFMLILIYELGCQNFGGMLSGFLLDLLVELEFACM
ncbi:hypothetical protein Patl1_13410 [Pistacia atlantica]|uniref:Uncharacterized protein n=1 Tax=Pistacia atlantica TaxID=434234 RepID=A0ACC1AVC4_9ROSI|nr:hypothetical protein Patl1_13410 [Pistacia atlantica]